MGRIMVGYVLISRSSSTCSYCSANVLDFKECARCGTKFTCMVPTYFSSDKAEMERRLKADPSFAHLKYVSPDSPEGLAAMRS
ncbi:hypothetical protein KC949_02430 [Candidatus Saccharibacteria bacterium]|nr:hypothetical protein [Candidatus Saccharibacteria bacterium]